MQNKITEIKGDYFGNDRAMESDQSCAYKRGWGFVNYYVFVYQPAIILLKY